MQVTKRDGHKEIFDLSKIQRLSAYACAGLDVSQSELEVSIATKFFDGIKTSDIHDAQIISAGELISPATPDYTYVAARLLLVRIYKEVTGGEVVYPHLADYVKKGIAEGRLDKKLSYSANFNLDRLNAAIVPDRDLLFNYLGMQTIADRYLLREAEHPGKKAQIIEMPQHFLMRVAMGLAMAEVNRLGAKAATDFAIRYYDLLSKHDGMTSTPTLFNSGTLHPQMSSCYLNTVADTLLSEEGANPYSSIYGTLTECAALSKWAGGIGTDWTRVRGQGDIIKGTNGKSAGVVPYLKVYNDTAVAVNQGGKRNGSFAPYLEPWHPDFMDFCELKKNTGDERRRAHDIFPASWLPDEFMRRVAGDGPDYWSFFSPSEYPELHELYGAAFDARYAELEIQGVFIRQLPVMEVWKKILTQLWETGHPWVTFKDECNRRNPQDHVGVVHNSNLCTEITLNTSDDETAVCNLASTNLSNHVTPDGGIDFAKLRETVRTQVRMLDSVIDLNFYPSERARNSNLRHRPVGLGVMGLADMLAKMKCPMDSDRGLEIQNELFEAWSYFAIEASSDLAAELGAYATFAGSKWSRGILPVDTARVRSQTGKWDWNALRDKVLRQGMRNSNVMAIAPTATISNIIGVTPSIEPPFERDYTKTNLSGIFTVIAPALRWDPEAKSAFEIDADWTIRGAAVRQTWIDQAQSVNIFVPADTRGSRLSDLYLLAWRLGLKTTYYLRRLTVETEDMVKDMNSVPTPAATEFCSIENPDCESCQ